MHSNEQRHDQIRVVAIVTALCLLGDSMLYIALPIFWREAGLDSLWQVGFLLSINRFVRLPANPLVGRLYQKVSLRTGLLIAIMIGSLTTIGYGVVTSFLGWIILRCLWGIAWSFFRIGGLSTVVQLSQDEGQGKAMGIYNGLYRTGSLVGMLIGGSLAPLLGFQVIAILFGAVSFLGVPLLIGSSKNKNRYSSTEINKQKSIGSVVYSKSNIWILMISSFFVTMFIQGVFTSTLSNLIQHHFGEHISLLGVVISVTALSGILQSVRWVWEPFLAGCIGHWSDGPKGRVPLLILSLLLSFATYGILSIPINIPTWIMIVLLSMLSATALTTLMDALAGDFAKSTNSVMFLTRYSVVQDVGAALGPLLGYLLLEYQHGFIYLYFGVSIIFLLLALFWFRIYRTQKISLKQ